MGGGASHFDDAVPLGTVEIFHTYYTRDNQRISLPSSFYSSEAYASQINRWISETPREQPIFAWLAFTAPHDPLQRRMNGLVVLNVSMNRAMQTSIVSVLLV